MTDIVSSHSLQTYVLLLNWISLWVGPNRAARGPQLRSFPSGLFVVKMEFLLGNPFSTPVGQCIGNVVLKLSTRFVFSPSTSKSSCAAKHGVFRLDLRGIKAAPENKTS